MLYPNNTAHAYDRYIARTSQDLSLSIDQICAVIKSRGCDANYDNIAENVKAFFDEAAYQLCNGYTVNTGYFSIHPCVCGTFESAKEPHNPVTNPITFRFRAKAKLRRLAEQINVVIDGFANGRGHIHEFIDLDAESVNDIYVPGNQFIISGYNIKIAGDNPDTGVYFVPVDNPRAAAKVTDITENSISRIAGIAPYVGSSYNRLEIRTQYTGTSITKLVIPRTICSNFIVEESRTSWRQPCQEKQLYRPSAKEKVSGL